MRRPGTSLEHEHPDGEDNAMQVTNRIEPAKAVMVSATRSWTAADRRSATARKAGCCGLRSWVSVICRSLSSLASADDQESDKPMRTA
jgi:hypothetical protein